MTELWSVVMLIAAGLFAGGVALIAWERVPAWREADRVSFRLDFAHTLQRVDRLQPAVLVVSLISSVGFAVSASGTARLLAGLAVACLLAVLIGSGAGLVPVQRRLVDQESSPRAADVERLRRRWLTGHLLRTGVSLVAFALLVVAAVT